MPWLVNGLMRVEQGVSPNATQITVGLTLVGFALIYAALMVADIYLLLKFARRGGAPQSQTGDEKSGFAFMPAE